MQRCKLVLTNTHDIVLVPEETQTGDVLCIIWCGYSPCLLRKVGIRGWRLISGDYYVFRWNSSIEGTLYSVSPYKDYLRDCEVEVEGFTIC
jgi:hypothetical protein